MIYFQFLEELKPSCGVYLALRQTSKLGDIRTDSDTVFLDRDGVFISTHWVKCGESNK
jgi:hypothetical protein